MASLHMHAAQNRIVDYVVFEGAMNQDRIRSFYAAADLFCLPSFAEGLPVVLMEAMAMGIPCVTTQITGIPELIRNGIDGMLVAPSDLDALVEALAKLMDDAALRERFPATDGSASFSTTICVTMWKNSPALCRAREGLIQRLVEAEDRDGKQADS